MFFKDISQWSQKKLKKYDFLFNALYFMITYLGPLITVMVMFWSINELIKTTTKITFMFIVIAAVIMFSATKFLQKKILKMRIFNIDGTYNRPKQNFKHIIEMISNLVFPIVFLFITVVFITGLKELLEFYMKMICISMIFFIVGHIIDGLFLAYIEDEVSIRDEVAKDNAKALRSSIT